MGCASSNPIVQSGKNFMENAKESASDFANKGEHIIEDVSDTAKDGIGHVKEAMGSALETAENSIGSVVGKIGDTFSTTKSEVKEAVEGLEEVTEDNMNKANDTMVEAVSEAETVLASEIENAKDMMDETKNTLSNTVDDIQETATNTKNMAFEKVDLMKDEIIGEAEGLKKDAKDALKLEDMEQSLEMIENDISDAERKVEEVVMKRLPTPAPSPPPEVEAQKEDSPTFWEAAADAILEKRMHSLEMELPESDLKPEIGSNHYHQENDIKMEDLKVEGTDTTKPRTEDYLGELCENHDKISMKSFILKDE